MTQPIILFDIDFTLFDTDIFMYARDAYLAKLLQKDLKIAVNYRVEYFQTLTNRREFDPKEFCQFIAVNEYISATTLYQQMYEEKSLYQQALYPEVKEVLTKFQKQNYQIGIFSEGIESFQLNKLRFCEIFDFFDSEYIIIFADKTTPEALVSLPSQAWIVDDKSEILEKIAAIRQDLKLILIKRQKIASTKTFIKTNDKQLNRAFTIINNLSEIN
ncbi:MAG: HAD hydrolase-like protein [bacterium]